MLKKSCFFIARISVEAVKSFYDHFYAFSSMKFTPDNKAVVIFGDFLFGKMTMLGRFIAEG